MWKQYSKIVYGKNRWIKIKNYQLFVNSNDYRVFLMFLLGGTQFEKIDTWRNLEV